MDDSSGVRMLQRLGDGEQARRRQLGRIERVPVGEGPQRLAADELGDQVARLRLRAREIVDVEDIRVMQPGDRVRLAIEALADLLAGMEVCVENLHGHGAAELRVPAPPHHGHSALPDLLLEPVPAELHYTSREP